MANLCTEAHVRALCENMVRVALRDDLVDGAPYLVGDDDQPGLIPEWSARFETDVGRVVSPVTETILVDGSGTNTLMLAAQHTPVISITSVAYPLSGDLDSTSYVLENDAGLLRLADIASTGLPRSEEGVGRFNFPRWPRGRHNITIVLRHGWEVTPRDVVGAVARACAADILQRDAGERDAGLRRKQLGDRDEEFGDMRHAAAVDRLRAQYDKVVFAYSAGVVG